MAVAAATCPRRVAAGRKAVAARPDPIRVPLVGVMAVRVVPVRAALVSVVDPRGAFRVAPVGVARAAPGLPGTPEAFR